MHNILLILRREVVVRVRRKAFIITTLLLPIVFVLLTALPAILMSMDSETGYKLGVVDATARIADQLKDSKSISYTPLASSAESPEARLTQDSTLDAILYIPSNAIQQPDSFRIVARTQPTIEVMSKLESSLEDIIEAQRVAGYDIPQLDSIMEAVRANVSIKTATLNDEGEAKETNAAITAAIGYVLGILCYMLIMISGGMVLQGVIEEKTNRIVEILVSSVTAFQLLMGKILGIATVFLLQIFIWIAFAAIMLPIAGMIFMPDAETVTAMQSNMPSVDVGVSMDTIQGGMQEILGPIMNINFTGLLLSFLVYLVFGYLLYAAAFAAAGSALDEGAQEAQGQLTLPITIPMLLAFMVMFKAIKAPDGALAFWFSICPLTSPIIMPVRVAYGVPFWQLALSIALLVGTFVFMTWIAARIYRRGILMYGKSFGWKDIWKWLRS